METKRSYDLDWLRVIAFGILILYHTGMMFNTWEWHIKNNQTTGAFEDLMAFVGQWRMPLLFFISGGAIWFALQRYTTGKFAKERIKRLFLPLAFGMFVIVPPQIYFEHLYRGGVSYTSYLDFYPKVLEFVPYPKGSFSWHHLWYLPYILVFSFLGLPFFIWARGSGRDRINHFLQWIADHNGFVLLGVPIAISEISLRPFWPNNANNLLADWAQFTTTFYIFCTGYILVSNEAIRDRIEKYRFKALGLALLCFLSVALFWIADLELNTVQRSFFRFCRSMNIWCWILTILGFGRKYLTKNHPFLKYATEAVYPFYIVHQTITIMIGFPLIDAPFTIWTKLVIVATGTFFFSWVVFEIIRRMNWTRVLFGLKPLPKTRAQIAVLRDQYSWGSE